MVPTSLSSALRDATREAHRAAEQTSFVGALLRAELPAAAFTALVVQHRAIYRALETVPPAWADDPVAGPFLGLEGLARSAALTGDLAVLGEPDPPRRVARATTSYVARVGELVAAGRTELWLAHHYVRYLGDVSGGQVVARAIRTGYGLGAATSFYDFTALGPVPSFRARYRALLDAAPVADPAAVVAEAVAAFDANRAVFGALGSRYGV